MAIPSPTPRTHSGASAHYETLLAELYAWMVGDLETAERAAHDELRRLAVGPPPPCGRALDLGAGIGLHAIPLAELGWDVTALDRSPTLLRAIAERSTKVHLVEGDLVHAAEHVDGQFDLVICMGDTLTHLDSEDAVDLAVAGAARRLAVGGQLLLRFRDYVTRTLLGAERFLLVRSDDTRIMTCCLDYETHRVLVTDIVHDRIDHRWRLRASSYRKLRLRSDAVVETLISLGLEVTVVDASPPWIEIVAVRPAA